MENGGKRAVAVWHRRAGKDVTAMNWTVVSAFERPGLYWHLLPTYNQGRKIVWDGRTREGAKFRDAWPEDAIDAVNETDMRIKIKNNSIWQVVGTDNIDRLVGPNPVGCVFSEYSLQDPRAWDLIRPILAENGGWAMFIYTPRGENHGHTMYERGLRLGLTGRWFSELLTVDMTFREDGTPVISQEAIQEERDSGMSEEMIQQEFYCSFSAPLVGAYYGDQMARVLKEGRICKVPWDPRLEVHTAWDLGIDDSMSIWFIQIHGFEYRLINYYENSGEGLPHYAKYLKEQPYVYGMHFAPHDIMVRELGTGRSRWEVAKELGIKFKANLRLPLEDGIEAVRSILPRCWFDEEKCERGVAGLRQYRKSWDEVRKVYSSSPEHDWTSHPADSFRTFAMGVRDKMKRTQPRPQVAESEYSVLNL